MSNFNICSKCGVLERVDMSDPNDIRIVCNCGKRRNGHELYPRCQLQPNTIWSPCLCAEIDPDDRPCVACDEMLDSAKSCSKCCEEAQARAASFADHLVKRGEV